MKNLTLSLLLMTIAACTTLTPEQREQMVARHSANERTMCNPAVCDSYTSNPNTSINRVPATVVPPR